MAPGFIPGVQQVPHLNASALHLPSDEANKMHWKAYIGSHLDPFQRTERHTQNMAPSLNQSENVAGVPVSTVECGADYHSFVNHILWSSLKALVNLKTEA